LKHHTIKQDIAELYRFISGYGRGYGNIYLFEVGNIFIIETYNGGWSENEESEDEFIQYIENSHIIRLLLSDHPCHLFKIKKEYFSERAYTKIVNSEFDCLRELGCYKKRKQFNYHLKIGN